MLILWNIMNTWIHEYMNTEYCMNKKIFGDTISYRWWLEDDEKTDLQLNVVSHPQQNLGGNVNYCVLISEPSHSVTGFMLIHM